MIDCVIGGLLISRYRALVEKTKIYLLGVEMAFGIFTAKSFCGLEKTFRKSTDCLLKWVTVKWVILK